MKFQKQEIGRVVARSKICKDCRATFTLTEGEMNFYKSMNFTEPERCSDCRRKRKEVLRNRGCAVSDSDGNRDFH